MSDDDPVRRFLSELDRLNPIFSDLQYRLIALEAMNTAALLLLARKAPDLAVEVLEKSLEAIPDPSENSSHGAGAFHMGLEQILLELRLKRGE